MNIKFSCKDNGVKKKIEWKSPKNPDFKQKYKCTNTKTNRNINYEWKTGWVKTTDVLELFSAIKLKVLYILLIADRW